MISTIPRLPEFASPTERKPSLAYRPIRSQVDRVWDAFWSGGISNPLSVIEQFTYLLFARRLDELHTAREAQANLLKEPVAEPIFGPDQQDLRWSRFKDFEAAQMFETFRDRVFPFIKNLSRNRESAYSRFLKDAVFIIPMPALLERVVTMISGIPMADRDTKGDLYEYLLSKIAQAGVNGQFRTPRHIIKMMVELVEPRPEDVIGDPACGTCGFLVLAGEYLRDKHPQMLHHKKQREHFQGGMFHGADFDASMLRIGAMNMMLHGIDNPDIKGIAGPVYGTVPDVKNGSVHRAPTGRPRIGIKCFLTLYDPLERLLALCPLTAPAP